MFECRAVRSIVLVGLLATIGTGAALAQEPAAARPGDRPGGDRGGRRRGWDPARMRQRYLDRTKEILGMGDQEWQALQPKIEELMTLSREASSRGGGRRGRRRETNADTPQSPIAAASEKLSKTLENEKATGNEIKAALTALREAREAAKEKLAKARADLRQFLTQRQEAQLVMMGILD